jgi:hypothetical protein
VEWARVDGKPRIVEQQYLGTAAEAMGRLQGGGDGEPQRTQHRAFGDVAAVWGVLERLGVAEVIDGLVGARRADAAGSVGTYLALATLNRVIAPCSKLGFADWRATPPGHAGSSSARLRWTTAGSGTRWTSWMRTSYTRPNARSVPGWSASSGWTCPGWRWT